jgi:hypothetical protein
MQHGSLLTVLVSAFPGVLNEELDLPPGEHWTLLTDSPVECHKCFGRAVYAIKIDKFDAMTGIVSYCSPEARIFKALDFSHAKLNELENEAKDFFKKNNIEDSKPVSLVDVKKVAPKKSELEMPSVTTIKIEVPPLTASVPIPEGYKNVAWLRTYEAQAIEKAYKLEKDISVETTSGKIVFTAKFFPSPSKEAQKYHANVKAIRIKKLGQEGVVGWIRLEEAKATIKASSDEKDLVFDHVTHGKGGKVQYFSPDSIEAKTFRSTTRLLRKK